MSRRGPDPPGPDASRVTRRDALAATAAWAVLAGLTVLVVTAWPPLLRLDARWSAAAVRLTETHAGLAWTVRALDRVGGGAAVTAASVALVLALLLVGRPRRPDLAAVVAAATLGGVLLDTLVKELVQRPRPPSDGQVLGESSWSFPSGHAAAGAYAWLAFAVVAAALGRRALAGALAAAGVIIAASRVLAGVHYPSDVVAGYALGLGWLLVVLGVATATGRAVLRPPDP